MILTVQFGVFVQPAQFQRFDCPRAPAGKPNSEPGSSEPEKTPEVGRFLGEPWALKGGYIVVKEYPYG